MPQVVHTNPTISSDFGDKKGFEVKAVVKSLMNFESITTAPAFQNPFQIEEITRIMIHA